MRYSGRLAADVEFELPTLAAVTADAPQLEHAQLGYTRLQVHRDARALVAVAAGVERRHQRRQLGELVAPGFDEGTGVIVAPCRRAEEAELGLLADDERELLGRQLDVAAFLESARHDAQGLQRRAHAGHGRHRALHPDIVRARRAAADAHTT